MKVITSFGTVNDGARAAKEMINEGRPLRWVWRFAVVQLMDDYHSVFRYEGLDAASRMWQIEPESVGDIRVDAAFAALAEYLARQDGWSTPIWALDPQREALPWWFVTELRGLHPRALVESPPSFRRRGVFITSDALERV